MNLPGEIGIVQGTNFCVNSNLVACLGAPKTGLLNAIMASEGEAWQTSVLDIGISQVAWRKYGTRRRHGVDFGKEWVAPLEYRLSQG